MGSDIILVGLRDYQDAKADVIQKYSADEARNLKSYGEFPESIKISDTVDFVGAIWMKTSSSMTLTATNPDLVVRILMISTIYEHLWILGFLMFCLCCIVMFKRCIIMAKGSNFHECFSFKSKF